MVEAWKLKTQQNVLGGGELGELSGCAGIQTIHLEDARETVRLSHPRVSLEMYKTNVMYRVAQ